MQITGHDWFLAEWIKAMQLTQAQFGRQAGWDKRKTSELKNGKQRYNRDTLNEAALALNIAPFEILLHPADAMAMRRFRDNARLIAAEPPLKYEPQPQLPNMARAAGK